MSSSVRNCSYTTKSGLRICCDFGFIFSVQCPKSNFDGANAHLVNCNSKEFGGTCTARCNNGWTGHDRRYKCQANGHFSQDPHAISCSRSDEFLEPQQPLKISFLLQRGPGQCFFFFGRRGAFGIFAPCRPEVKCRARPEVAPKNFWGPPLSPQRNVGVT